MINAGLKPVWAKNLKLIFVGFNPHPASVKKGSYFSSNTAFWNQLYSAGLTEKKITSNELHLYKFGIDDLVQRPTITPKDLSAAEFAAGVEKLKANIKAHNPKVVCFIGKGPYEKFVGKKISFDYGSQGLFWRSKLFVIMFPTARGTTEQKVKVLRKLKEII